MYALWKRLLVLVMAGKLFRHTALRCANRQYVVGGAHMILPEINHTRLNRRISLQR